MRPMPSETQQPAGTRRGNLTVASGAALRWRASSTTKRPSGCDWSCTNEKGSNDRLRAGASSSSKVYDDVCAGGVPGRRKDLDFVGRKPGSWTCD
jgi:hypothetical protein